MNTPTTYEQSALRLLEKAVDAAKFVGEREDAAFWLSLGQAVVFALLAVAAACVYVEPD